MDHFEKISPTLASNFVNKVKIDISFKSLSGNAWTGLKLISGNLFNSHDIGIEKYAQKLFEQEMFYISENEELTEGKILDMIKNVFRKIVDKIKELIQKGMSYFMKFMGIEPEKAMVSIEI